MSPSLVRTGWLPRPRSLFTRHLLVIVLLVCLGQLGGALVVRELLLKPRLNTIGQGLARTVDAVRAGLEVLPPAERAQFVARFNQHAALNQALAPPPSASARPRALSPLERSLVQTVSSHLAQHGDDIIWRREDGGSLALRMGIEGTDYWVVLPGLMPMREFTGTLLAGAATGLVVALLGALLIQRRLHQPLDQLVQATQALSSGAAPQPLPEDGPTEIAAVSRSFNQMARHLQATEQARALMLAGVSHDLRTPLTKLRIATEILAPHEPTLVAGMVRSIESMDAMVGQFLDFARDDAAEPLVPVDITALAHTLAQDFAAHGQAITLDTQPTSPLPLRALGMHRVLTNLLENAWRHGRAPVVLRTTETPHEICVDVVDHGKGIAAQDIEQLKQPFQRGDSARGHGTKGTGLGLAIADRIVRLHGGQLELMTPPDGGLCARVRLPRRPPG